MKAFSVIVFLFSGQLLAQTPVYNISFMSLDGNTVTMANHQGRKIIIESASPLGLLSGQLDFLDSLQMNNPSVTVIALITGDSISDSDSLAMESLKADLSNHVIVSAISPLDTTNGREENQLLKWLTNLSENTHFEADSHADGQLYMISESGVLYAVLERGSPPDLITELIAQTEED